MMYRRLDTSLAAEPPRSTASRARDILIGVLAGGLIALSFVWARPAGAKVVVDTWSVPGPDEREGKGTTAGCGRALLGPLSPLSPDWIWDRKPIRKSRA